MDATKYTVKEGIKVTLPYIITLLGEGVLDQKPIPLPVYNGQCLLIDSINSFDKSSVEEVISELEKKTREYFKRADDSVEASKGTIFFTGLKEKNESFGFLVNHIFKGDVRQVIYRNISHSEFKHLKYNLELQFIETGPVKY